MEDYLAPLMGGILIGLASSLLLLFKGKIFGISGILFGVLQKPDKEFGWRLSIIVGIISGSFIFNIFFPSLFSFELNGDYFTYALGGLMVGFGTKLGSGCTSGHGVCGIGRLSVRSITATLTFMFFGVLTVWIMGV